MQGLYPLECTAADPVISKTLRTDSRDVLTLPMCRDPGGIRSVQKGHGFVLIEGAERPG
jgi:hypothetical protein